MNIFVLHRKLRLMNENNERHLLYQTNQSLVCSLAREERRVRRTENEARGLDFGNWKAFEKSDDNLRLTTHELKTIVVAEIHWDLNHRAQSSAFFGEGTSSKLSVCASKPSRRSKPCKTINTRAILAPLRTSPHPLLMPGEARSATTPNKLMGPISELQIATFISATFVRFLRSNILHMHFSVEPAATSDLASGRREVLRIKTCGRAVQLVERFSSMHSLGFFMPPRSALRTHPKTENHELSAEGFRRSRTKTPPS